MDYAPKPLDVWAFGVSLYAFMYETLPFYAATDHELESCIRNNELVFSDSVPTSEQFKELLQALLNKNPDERPSIAEAKARFQWLQRPDFPSERPPPENPNTAEETKDNHTNE